METLASHLESYRNHSSSDELDTKEELDVYMDSLKQFSDYNIRLLGKFRYIYSSAEKNNITELGRLLL